MVGLWFPHIVILGTADILTSDFWSNCALDLFASKAVMAKHCVEAFLAWYFPIQAWVLAVFPTTSILALALANIPMADHCVVKILLI